jgi:hypothetical protein
MAPAQLFRDERCIAARYFGVPSHDGGWPETRQRAGDEEDGAARAEEEDPQGKAQSEGREGLGEDRGG